MIWVRMFGNGLNQLKEADNEHQATMGGSWWYGQRQMKANYGAQTKPEGMLFMLALGAFLTDRRNLLSNR